MRRLSLIFALMLTLTTTVEASDSDSSKTLPTIEKKTTGMQFFDGWIPFYWDKSSGKLWLELSRFDEDLLYVTYLSRGVGSNDLGLDRGRIGDSRVIKFVRFGRRVLMVQPNLEYRADSDNQAQKRAVLESFALSVLWGFSIGAENSDDDRVLVDATDLFLSDAFDIPEGLTEQSQGNYKLESSRSAFNLSRTKNFPSNTEIDVILTFVGDKAGRLVRQVVPTSASISVYQHHSFVKLPNDGYQPRRFDPRAGYFAIEYKDLSAPLGEPQRKRLIARHDLRKVNRGATRSEVVEPIVYYVDRAIPEPMRSTVIEAAGWWKEAFDSLGYIDAFRVELLPADIDPLDIRYNMIQWVHRATRGWSYGSSIVDPRTGQIIKGHITLGSLRLRQDYLLAEGLLAPYESEMRFSMEAQEMALARLGQLAAHEVGHTLGLRHNFVASSMGRLSVMDYAYPKAELNDEGAIDLTSAYDIGIRSWDRQAIAYGYSEFPKDADESATLDSIVRDGLSRGLVYLSDGDARSPGGMHPTAHLWDNGADAIEELERIMALRERILERFSLKNISEGELLGKLEEVLAPMYLFHRYQIEAVSKLLAGVAYTHAVRGDGQPPSEVVSAAVQRDALEALTSVIEPNALALPEHILSLIPPHRSEPDRARESFNGRTGMTLDPIAAAESVAEIVLSLIFNSERANRLQEQHLHSPGLPSFNEVAERVIAATWDTAYENAYRAEINRAVAMQVLRHLMVLTEDSDASSQVRAIAYTKIDDLRKLAGKKFKRDRTPEHRAYYLYAKELIERFQKEPDDIIIPEAKALPAGPPIGQTDRCGQLAGCD